MAAFRALQQKKWLRYTNTLSFFFSSHVTVAIDNTPSRETDFKSVKICFGAVRQSRSNRLLRIAPEHSVFPGMRWKARLVEKATVDIRVLSVFASLNCSRFEHCSRHSPATVLHRRGLFLCVVRAIVSDGRIFLCWVLKVCFFREKRAFVLANRSGLFDS